MRLTFIDAKHLRWLINSLQVKGYQLHFMFFTMRDKILGPHKMTCSNLLHRMKTLYQNRRHMICSRLLAVVRRGQSFYSILPDPPPLEVPMRNSLCLRPTSRTACSNQARCRKCSLGIGIGAFPPRRGGGAAARSHRTEHPPTKSRHAASRHAGCDAVAPRVHARAAWRGGDITRQPSCQVFARRAAHPLLEHATGARATCTRW